MATMNCVFALMLIIAPVFAGRPCAHTKKVNVPQYIIDGLFQRVQDGQILSEVPAKFEGSKEKTTGDYKSMTVLHHVRDRPRVYQKWQVFTNMVTSTIPLFVTTVLLEGYLYGSAPNPSEDKLISTLDYCFTFRDLDTPYNSPNTRYGPAAFSESHQVYICDDHNVPQFKKLYEDVPNQDLDRDLMRNESITGKVMIELDKKVNSQTWNNFNLFQELIFVPKIIKSVTDADATFLWLGIGSTLEILRKEFPLVRDTWINYNLNISAAFDTLKKYAYRPFSNDPLVNTVQPGNYYYLRHFLDEAKAAGKDVIFPGVWFTNADEYPQEGLGIFLHYMTQYIDLLPTANIIYSITNLIFSKLVDPEIFQDKDVRYMYRNASTLLAYSINSNFTHRPDLAMVYYPSRYMFYFLVARTVSVIDSYKRRRDITVEDIEIVFNELKHAMEGEATRFLTSDAKHDDDGSFYFDDFLGNGDLTEDNQPIIRGEDRIFTTSMAVNALMYTWLSFVPETGKSYWKVGTPNDVKDIVNGCIMWLVTNALGDKFKPLNIILTSESKGRDNNAFRYPSNKFFEMPQLYVQQFVSYVRLIVGVQGYIPKHEYDAMLNSTQFGKPTPTVFKGYNHPDFSDKLAWSSDSLTYAAALLAVSRYREIEVN